MIAAAELYEWVQVSQHAEARARQRGFRKDDVELILAYGTETDEGTVLTAGDARRGIEALKRQIAAIERLAGAAVVTDGEQVVTLYHSRPGRARHMLRRAGRRCRRT